MDHPRTRRTDPVSSRLAAAELYHCGEYQRQKDMVLNALRGHDGSTSTELGAVIGMMEVPHRRLADLERAGLVERGLMRRCEICRRICLTWWVRR